MKKSFFSIRRVLVAASTMLVAGALLSSCKKDTNGNTDIPVSALMAFNLSPDQTAAGFALSGNLLTNSPLSYSNYTGGYRNIFPGQRTVQSHDYTKDTTLVTADFNFETQKYYSLFLVGNNGVYKNVIVADDIDSLPSNQAYVRYINAIPDPSVPTVTIKANGNNVSSDPAAFSTVSTFTAVNTGDINISVTNGNSISANRNIPVENGKIYTVLLIGVPASTDSLKAVQIKYIVNGTISPDDQK